MTTRIVVGIDGSESARAALDWAWDEAKRWGAELEVVHAWSYPYAYGVEGAVVVAPQTLSDDAKKLADEELAGLQARKGADVHMTMVVEEGGAAHTLLDRGKDAAMIVVGARGHGGFLSLLVGSVADQVVHHAPCPVVVVRHPG
jgi:nucleotide-binding universal stress UspA family protein